MTEKKKPEIVFMPGCFDGFDGTQEELDELIASIEKMFETGEIPEGAEVIEYDAEEDEIEDVLEHIPDEYNGMPKILH